MLVYILLIAYCSIQPLAAILNKPIIILPCHSMLLWLTSLKSYSRCQLKTNDDHWKFWRKEKIQQTITDDCNVYQFHAHNTRQPWTLFFDSKQHRVNQHASVCWHVQTKGDEPLTATKKWGDVGWNWTHWISSFNLLNGCCQQQSHDDVNNWRSPTQYIIWDNLWTGAKHSAF